MYKETMFMICIATPIITLIDNHKRMRGSVIHIQLPLIDHLID